MTGYYLSTGACAQCSYTCAGCDILKSNCTSCPASSFRTLTTNQCPCDAGYVDNGTAVCVTCNSFMNGCSSCSSKTTCTACDTSNLFSLSTGKCICPSGYHSTPTTCSACNSTLTSFCLTCSSASICTSCQSPWTVVSGSCSCPAGYTLDTAGNCTGCPIGCATCSNAACLTCVTGFELNGTTNCDTEICGDGKLFILECDDGNNEDGDGCSHDCKIEANFSCVNGSSTKPSVCSYTKALEIKLQKITKEVTSNVVNFILDVRPIIASLKTYDWNSVVKINMQSKSSSKSPP